MDTFWQDLRYGMRMLMKSPGFMVVAVLTLSLGIGANTAIFSSVNAARLNPFPYRGPDRLMIVQDTFKQEPTSVAFLNYLDWQQQNHVFEAMAAIQDRTFNFTGIDEPEQINGALVSASVFPMLGIEPLLGCSFLPEEDQRGAERLVVLSYRLWQHRFGADRNIIGQRLKL